MGVKHENLVLLTGNPKYVLKKKKKKTGCFERYPFIRVNQEIVELCFCGKHGNMKNKNGLTVE